MLRFRLLYNSFLLLQPPGCSGPDWRYAYGMADPLSPAVPPQDPRPAPIRWADVPTEAMNPLLSRAFITGAEAMIARIDLKQGCVVPRHSHPNEQIAWIVQGALLFSLGEAGADRQVTVRAGEVLVIPGNLPHAAEALEDTVDYDIFAPPRQDWINKDDAYLR